MNIDENLNDGIIIISDHFDINSATGSIDSTPYFNQPGDEYTLSFTALENVKKFTKFTYDTLGINDNRYLLQYYRISRDGNTWTTWLDLNKFIENFPLVDVKDPLFIDIKWIRKGNSSIGSIRLLEYKLEGKLERSEVSFGAPIVESQTSIIKPPFIYKVFKITDLEILPAKPEAVTIYYRYSQDSSRTWSNWEPLTKENITTTRINPIRFFQIEYQIVNETGGTINIQDINLIGDFQNVTEDSRKTNLFGIRECCQSNLNGIFDENGNFIPNTTLNTTGGGPSCDANVFSSMTDEEKAQLYNPYQQNTAVQLLEKLSNDAQEVFGHSVTYYATDADKNGQDHTLNEYQLYNVVCYSDLKVAVEGNNFPDSQVTMNQFDLNLFESMEVHITKRQFKEAFGVQRRPSKEDFLFFCNLNRMYQVDHAQQFRSFNNAAVYYKLILKKYNKKSNVQAGSYEIQNNLDELTKNSTIDSLFGIEVNQDKLAVANKQQYVPLSREPIRLEYFAEIDKENIENSSTIISKSHYDLSSVDYRNIAVSYKNFDPKLVVSDNIGFSAWFNINNYIEDEIYNMFTFYDDINFMGWKSELSNDTFTVTLNSATYSFNLNGNNNVNVIALEEETWYCYVLNIDQRNRTMEQFIYKRNVDDESDAESLSNTLLRKEYSDIQNIEPIEYLIPDINPVILASDMKYTNIRLFVDVIPESTHNKILNQYIIGDDSKYLVFADNCTVKLSLPRFPYNE